ncbi:MAG: Dabb family protein [Microbacterium sp.]
MAVRHIFLWSVKDGYDGEAILQKLGTLKDLVPGLMGWSIGKHEGEIPNASTGKWQYGLTVDVADWEALDAYQSHPSHEAIIREIEDEYDDWVVVDYSLS